jgi:hypothetical protein
VNTDIEAVHISGGETMERTNSKPEDQDLPVAPENETVLSVDDLDQIAGGTISDPCEGGQFRGR